MLKKKIQKHVPRLINKRSEGRIKDVALKIPGKEHLDMTASSMCEMASSSRTTLLTSSLVVRLLAVRIDLNHWSAI